MAEETRHRARFTAGNTERAPDGRLLHPTCFRNGPPMIAALAGFLGGRSGRVIEIGAGTGQHAAAFALAFPDLAWWPSDPDPGHHRSITAWQAFCRAPERPPLALDASGDWPAEPAVAPLLPLTAVVAMNVVHIAPMAVAEGIVRGAGRALVPGGLLILYGPFNEDGRPTGPGNAGFDRDLRAADPAWGLRDVEEIAGLAREAGLGGAEVRRMPADNRLLVFRRRDRDA